MSTNQMEQSTVGYSSQEIQKSTTTTTNKRKMLLFINSILVLILSLTCQLIECGAYPAITPNNNNNNNRFNSLNFANRQQMPFGFAQNDNSTQIGASNPSRPNNVMQNSQQQLLSPTTQSAGSTNRHLNLLLSSSVGQAGAPLQSINNQNPYTTATNNALLELRQQMLNRAVKFDENFRSLLTKSKISLHNMFVDTYGMMYERNVDIFTSMYESLEQYYARGDVNLTKSMSLFFERLYQKIFQEINVNRSFSASYLDCATDQLNSLKPFKDAPEKLIGEVRHAFVAARTFYQALNSGIDVIKTILTLGQPSQCTNLIHDKLLKVFSAVQQHPSRQLPCLNYCEQVMTRCVGRNNLDLLSDKWKSYVLSLGELAKKLSFHYNIETIISPLDVQISEAIMNFQENAGNITTQVLRACSTEASPVVAASHQHGGSMMKPMGANRLSKRAATASPRQRQANNLPRSSYQSSDLSPLSMFDTLGNFQRSAGNSQPNRATTRLVVPSSLSEVLGDHLQQSSQLAKRSPILIDEIKNFMQSTRLFWSALPNSVCTSNTTVNSITIPLAIQSNSQQPPASRRPPMQQQQQSNSGNCFQEPLNMADMNTDLRYQTEIQSQVNKLESMIAKIRIALEGQEIDWQPATGVLEQTRNPSPVAPPVPASGGRPYQFPTTSTTTTTTPEPLTDDEQSGGGDEEDIEPGSGQSPDGSESSPDESPDDPDYSTTESPDSDDYSEESDEYNNNNNQSTGGDKDKSQLAPTVPSSIPDDEDLAQGKPTPTMDITNDLITPPDFGAQKSSGLRSPFKLVITATTLGGCELLFALLFALSIVNQIR